MSSLILNTTLSLEQLPHPTNESAIFAFAMSFDGYKHFGSFEAAAENAKAMRRESLTDLRNELFMSARASRHSDNDMFLVKYNELLPLFKQIIGSGRLT